jgi:hypothetical protein
LWVSVQTLKGYSIKLISHVQRGQLEQLKDGGFEGFSSLIFKGKVFLKSMTMDLFIDGILGFWVHGAVHALG